MSEIGPIERELAELRSRFKESFKVLEELSRIQTRFEKLIHTQQELEACLHSAQTFLKETQPTIQAEVESRFLQLEAELETKGEQLQADLTSLKQDFDSTTDDLRAQLETEKRHLRKLEHEHANQPTMPVSPEKLTWMENSVQELGNAFYNDRSFLQDLDRRLMQVKRSTDVLTAGGLILFSVLIVVFVASR